MNQEFLKRIKNNKKYDEILLGEAKTLSSLKPFEIKEFPKLSEEELLELVEKVLKQIDSKYYEQFINMYNEQDCDNPVIYSLTSNKNILENESNTYNHEIFFYRTNTLADVYLLLHEFSHFLVNRNNSYQGDMNKKRYDEILPILMEFIISDIINNYEYLKIRFNKTIFYSKSILVKEEINNGNYDLDNLFKKYSFSKDDIEFFKNDLLFSKSLEYEEEKRYIYGFIYANYYSTIKSIDIYKSLVEQYTDNRNILLPMIHFYKLNNNLYKFYK